MRQQVEGTWADATSVFAEIDLTAEDGHTYTLIVYDAHYKPYDGPGISSPARSERRVVLENEARRPMIDYSVHEPSSPHRLPSTYRLVKEVGAEVDDLTYSLAVWTDSSDYDDPSESIYRRLAVVVRKDDKEHWLHECSVGYVREVEYVPPPRPPAPPIVWPEEVEWEPALYCPDCDTYVDLDSGIPLYECSRCGQASPDRRCEQCNIFTAKLTDAGCPECEQAELEEAEAARDMDGNLHSTEEIPK